MDLFRETSNLLKKCQLSYPWIAKELKCSVTYLRNVAAMRGDTGILKLRKLNKWLKEEEKHREKQSEAKK